MKFVACWLAARPLGRRGALAVLVGVSAITSLLAPPAIRRAAGSQLPVPDIPTTT